MTVYDAVATAGPRSSDDGAALQQVQGLAQPLEGGVQIGARVGREPVGQRGLGQELQGVAQVLAGRLRSLRPPQAAAPVQGAATLGAATPVDARALLLFDS